MSDSLRKSERSRKRTSYFENDFKLDLADIDLEEEALPVRKTPKVKKLSTPVPDNGISNFDAADKNDVSNMSLNSSFDDGASRLSDNPESSILSGGLSDGQANISSEQMQALLNKQTKKKPELIGRCGGRTCEICEKVCVDEASYNRHIKSHSPNRKHRCEICQKAFKDSTSLKRHVRSHGDDRPFTCDLCFKSFRDGPSLTRHHQTHMDRPKVFSCNICSKSFADKHGLTRHNRIHTGLRPFECPICHKTFSESGSFKRHEKIHVGVKKYACLVCNKKFLEKQSLLRHQKVVCGVGGDTTQFMSQSENTSQDSFASLDNSVADTSFDGGGSSESVAETPPKSRRKGNRPNGSSAGSRSKLNVSSRAQSLQSLMKGDPNLSAGISDLVDSIGSYEQMLDLCGDKGQSHIDAALTREGTLDNLMCFECGEHLVDGENFRKEGKVFDVEEGKTAQFRCICCEDDGNVMGTGGKDTVQRSGNDETHSREQTNGENVSKLVKKKQKNDIVVVKEQEGFKANSQNQEEDESLRIFKESMQAHQSSLGSNKVYPDLLQGSGSKNDRKRLAGTNASISYFSSGDESDDLEPKVTFHTSVDLDGKSMPDSLYKPEIGKGKRSRNVLNSESNDPRNEDTSSDDDSMSKRSITNKDIPPSSSHAHNTLSPVSTKSIDYTPDETVIPAAFPCHLCTKVFASREFLSQHLDLHKQSPHKCMVCGKTFTTAVSRRRHMLTHTGEKPYSCPNCLKSFRDPSNFSKHKKVCKAPKAAFVTYAETCREQVPRKPGRKSKNEELYDAADLLLEHMPYLQGSYGARDISAQPLQPATMSPSSVNGEGSHPVHFSYDNIDQVGGDGSNKGGDDDSDGDCDDDANLPVSFGGLPPDQDDLGEDSDQTVDGDDYQDAAGKGVPDNENSQERENVFSKGVKRPEENVNNGSVRRNEAGNSSGSAKNPRTRTPKSIIDKKLDEANNPDSIKKVSCKLCSRVYNNDSDLQLHMRYHSAKNPDLTCAECGKSFNLIHGLKRHERIHSDNRPHVCEFCQRGYCDSWSLRKHHSKGCLTKDLQVPMDIMVPCPQCNRVFSNPVLQSEHISEFHKGALKFECDVCLKRFSEAFNLRRHRRLHMAICNKCEKEFPDIKALEEHRKTECTGVSLYEASTEGKGDHFPCPECARVYTTKANLERHKKIHIALKPFACQVCPKRFTESHKLKRHMKIHEEVKPYHCERCMKGFNSYVGLRQHHQKTQCALKFGPVTFDTSSSTLAPSLLPDNDDSVNDEQSKTPVLSARGRSLKPAPTTPSQPKTPTSKDPGNLLHHCHICRKVFLKKFLLVRHMNVHSADRPYICGQCGKAYKDTSSLKRHCILHKGYRSFMCSLCGKSFFYLDSLRRHQKSMCVKSGNTVAGASAEGDGSAASLSGRDLLGDTETIHMKDAEMGSRKRARKNAPNKRGTSHSDVGPTNSFRIINEHSSIEAQLQESNRVGYGHRTCHFQLRSRDPPVGLWSCAKGRFCWRCTIYLPSHYLFLQHVRVHSGRNKRYTSTFGHHRWTRKVYRDAEFRIYRTEVKSFNVENNFSMTADIDGEMSLHNNENDKIE